MTISKRERDKAWNALNGRKPMSMEEVHRMEQKMSPQDRDTFHNLMWGKESKSPKEVYDMLDRNMCPEGYEYVRPYRKDDGTYVRGHCARRR